ncbi:aldo/keto reductase [Paenibacillus mesotrionivorans]|uniref:Aldo/keto reductase n=1 Tax=Paenibacillus mesotrionivorans TaxID=3160968 RepID=A0ACC7P1B3_9BACL
MNDFVLNNGVALPKVGLGVYKFKPQHESALIWALQNGYRHIDTASFYHNEELIARAIQKSGIKRTDVFLTTKVWSSDLGKRTKQAFESSLRRLQTDYVDLYLIHWPAVHYMESWFTLERLYKEGKIRAIGVANFERKHLEDVLTQGSIVPAVNQIQTNPYYQQEDIHGFLAKHGIQHVAWGPFGQGNKQLFSDPVLTEIAQGHGKTTAQIMLRWSLQRDIAVIPKSINPSRLKQNLEVFDFHLSAEEMGRVAVLERNQKGFNDPSNKFMLWMTRYIR